MDMDILFLFNSAT